MMKRGCLGGLAVLFAIFYFGYWGLMYWDNSRMLGRATYKLHQAEKADERGYDERYIMARANVEERKANIARSVFWGTDVPIAIGAIAGLLYFLRRRSS